jgi:hypothetical protein
MTRGQKPHHLYQQFSHCHRLLAILFTQGARKQLRQSLMSLVLERTQAGLLSLSAVMPRAMLTAQGMSLTLGATVSIA